MSPRRAGTKGRRIVQQLVLVFFLVLLWVMLWDSLTVLSVVTGIILAFLLTRVFYLPPVVLSGRFNVLHALVFAVWFAYSLVLASVESRGTRSARRRSVRVRSSRAICAPARTS